MERVKKGEKYWYLHLSDFGICSMWDWEDDSIYESARQENNNYFHTEEEAEAMAEKIRKVLNGADVIEMPSEEELEMIAELEYPTGTDCYLRSKGIKLAQAAFNGGIRWLKSKIINQKS